MADMNPAQSLESLLPKLDPNNLRYSSFGPDEDLTVDTLNEIEGLLEQVADSVPEDKYDEFHESLESLRTILYGDRIMKVAEFDFAKHEQEIWEENNPSEEENVSAVSEAANSAAIDKLDEVVEFASKDLESLKAGIAGFVARANDA